MKTHHVSIQIDGRHYEAEAGKMLLPFLLEKGFSIPHFCYHESLGVDGNCRMCMVEIEGKKRPQISCDTPIQEGMEVRTQGDSIEKVRRDILELELINHPVDCPICDQAGECSLQDYYMEYGLYQGQGNRAHTSHFEKHIDLGGNVMLDRERCVLCQRCVRFCADVAGSGELCVAGRGDASYITPFPGEALHSDYAMNITDLCPVGALTSKDFRFQQRVWFLATSPSVCHGCAKGCAIHIDHAKSKYHDDTIYRFRPRSNPRINGDFICDTGRLSYKETQENLLSSPHIQGKEIDEDTAITHLHAIIQDHTQIVVLADANLYTEDLQSIQQFSEAIGARLYAPLAPYHDDAFGDDWLKSPMRAANAAGVRYLGSDTTMPAWDDNVLVINMNHPHILKGFRRIEFRIHPPAQTDAALLTLPVAPFVQYAGHITNEDGIEQFCEQALHLHHPSPSVSDWLTRYRDTYCGKHSITTGGIS